jgi:hypothetical protein
VLRTIAPLIAVALAGCASPPDGFQSPVPRSRLDAITRAAESRDQGSVPDLITMLESDDPVVRLAAIRTLERITGTTLGYDYAAPDWQRREKIQAWTEWYRQKDPAQNPPPASESRGTGPGNADSVSSGSPPGP